MVADGLTKALGKEQFAKFRADLGLKVLDSYQVSL
jgi:hypothetical protein